MTIWFLDLVLYDEDGTEQLWINDTAWMDRAACASSGELLDDFFAEETSDGQPTEQVLAAKRLCSECRVRPECLDWAFSTERNEEFRSGTFGGLSATERMFVAQADDPIAMGLRVLDQQVELGLVLTHVTRYAEEEAHASRSER